MDYSESQFDDDIYDSDPEASKSVPASIVPKAVDHSPDLEVVHANGDEGELLSVDTRYSQLELLCLFLEIQFIHMNSEIIHSRRSKASKPEPMGSKRKRRQGSLPLEKPTSRKKKAKSTDSNADEGEEESMEKPPKQVTAYIQVAAPAALPATSTRVKKVIPKPPAVKGPFFFSTVDSFESFKMMVAKALPCKPKLLPIDKMQWAYEKPKNAS
jgi:hypothetical protein